MFSRRASINAGLMIAAVAVAVSVLLACQSPRLENRGVVGYLLCAIDGTYINEDDLEDPYIASQRAREFELIVSRQVVDNALRSSKVASLPLVNELTNPAAWIRERLSAQFIHAGVLEVSLQDPEAPLDALHAILRAVIDAYQVESSLRKFVRNQQRCDTIRQHYREIAIEIAERRAEETDQGGDVALESLLSDQARLAELIDQEVNVDRHFRGSVMLGVLEPTGFAASIRRLGRRFLMIMN